MVLKGIKLRLYPNKEQELLLKQMCENSRFLWNTLNGMLRDRYENNKDLYDDNKSKEIKVKRKYIMLSAFDMNYLLPQLKIEFPFLVDSDSSALQVVTANLNTAYSNFFKNPKHFGKPHFKRRKIEHLSYTGKSKIHITGNRYLKVPKLGYIKTSKTKRLDNCIIKRYTVERDATKRWYITFQVETAVTPFEKTGKIIGLDLGLNDMICGSDGYQSGRFLNKRLEKQINLAQRRYSKRRHYADIKISMDKYQKVMNPRSLFDFSNVEQARVTKAKLQRRLADQRKDFLHKLSTKIVKENDVIIIENLKSKNMMKNHRLAKSIANASWYDFRKMLEYKCEWYGKQLIVVPPHYTSQECSYCRHRSDKKALDIREWICENCGTTHHRDVNAAQNILNKGLAMLA